MKNQWSCTTYENENYDNLALEEACKCPNLETVSL